MKNIIYQLIKLKTYIQLFFLIILNSDIAVFIKSISTKKAAISQSGLKRFCIPALNCYSCPSAVSSCPIGALQFWLNDVSMKLNLGEKINLAGLYIIGFLSLFGGVGGRIACGWICPFGFIQDLIHKIFKINIRLPKFSKYIKYITLVLFVIILPTFVFDIALLSPWFCKYICPSGTLMAGIPLLSIDANLRETVSYISIIKFTILGIFLVLFFISRRSFCKTLCPLGAFWGLFNKISVIKLNLDKNRCINCKKCEKACPMNIEVTQNQNSVECIRCFECVKVCPTKCLDVKVMNNTSPRPSPKMERE